MDKEGRCEVLQHLQLVVVKADTLASIGSIISVPLTLSVFGFFCPCNFDGQLNELMYLFVKIILRVYLVWIIFSSGYLFFFR